MNCPFCEINENKTRILAMRGRVYVTLSNPALMLGHLLVIPYRHVEKISELSSDEKEDLWNTAEEFQERILQGWAPGCDIVQNYRPFISQSNLKVNHLHVHLRPRRLHDELYQRSQRYESEIFRVLNEDVLDRFHHRFKD